MHTNHAHTCMEDLAGAEEKYRKIILTEQLFLGLM